MLTGRRLAITLSVFALFLGGITAGATGAFADDPPIVVTPGGGGGGGTVGIGVHKSGGGGDQDRSAGAKGGGDSTNPCVADEVSSACQTYLAGQKCSAIAGDWAGASRADGPIGVLTGLGPAQLAELDASLAANGCPPWTRSAAPPTTADLAQAAYGELLLPRPMPSRYPKGTLKDGRPYTIVNTHMWFWTDPSAWKPLSKRVCAGALCATATAKPTSLTFEPGNGDHAVTCPGSGTAWVSPTDESWAPGRQPEGCDYQYTRSTYGFPNGELTATYTITWTVTWTGTNGTSGTLNPLTTTANSRFAVAELQSVVTQ
jgi:hypothetical protein